MRSFKLQTLILALRNEYKENQLKLEALKQYIELPDEKKVKSLDVYNYVQNNNKIIEFEIIKKQSIIINMINLLTDNHNKYTRKIEIAHEKDGKHKYIVLPKNEATINDLEELAKEAYAILEDRFINNIYMPTTYFDDAKMEIRTSPNRIYTHTDVLIEKYLPTSLEYSTKSDSIIVTSDDDPIHTQEMKNILNAELPIDSFPKYHQNRINNYLENHKEKEIIIDGLKCNKDTQTFSINDSFEDEVLLTKTKR